MRLYSITILTCMLFASGCGSAGEQVLAFGDSVTWGFGGLPYGWVGRLEAASSTGIANWGNPGERSRGGATRLANTLSTHPQSRVVMILHGGNDWVKIFRGEPCLQGCAPEDVDDQYKEVGKNLRRMRREVSRNGKQPVFSTYWFSRNDQCPQYDEERFANYQLHLARLNQEIINVADTNGDPVVRLDEIDVMTTDNSLWYDCLHPSADGYAKISDKFLSERSKWQPEFMSWLPASKSIPVVPGIEAVLPEF